MTNPALQVALAYHRAWTGKDLDAAMGYLADNVVCDAPAGRIEGIQAYREFLAPFAERLLVSAQMIAAFGDDSTAVLMYDTETIPAKSAPAAECVTVHAGKIVHNWFVFDRTPFDEFRGGRQHPSVDRAHSWSNVGSARAGTASSRTGGQSAASLRSGA